MRCVIARYPFDLTKAGLEQSMTGVPPEPSPACLSPSTAASTP
jgi:hypothetical protein